MENNVNKKNPLISVLLVIVVVLIISLVGIIVYISYQYSTNQELKDAAQEQEITQQQTEKTYEEKIRDGDIILKDE